MDRFQSLRAFVAVVNAGSFARAAERLGLSRAMMSKHVQQLEDRLGARLLQRTTRRLSLTEAGRAFHARAERLLADLEEAETAVASEGAAPRGTLRISAPVSFGARWVAPALAEFLAAHDGLAGELVLNDRIVDLVEEGFDLAIRIARLTDSSLIARRLAVSRFALVAAPGYLARAGAPRAPADLAKHNCLGYAYAATGDTWKFVRQGGGASASVRVRGTLTANNGDALAAAARQGLGVAVLPTFQVGDDLRQGTLTCLLEGWEPEALGVHAVYPQNRHLSAKVRAFVDFLAERFGPTPPWDAWMAEAPRRRSPAASSTKRK
jgi:DNA-binding transcriptional LysR family regulator